jgi:hypothetical protein
MTDSDTLARIAAGFTPGAVGIWVGVLGAAGMLFKRWIENRKLTIDERQAKREGFSAQVEFLTKENRQLREDYDEYRSTAEDRYDRYRRQCEQETEQLRDQLRAIQDDMIGLKRKFDAQADALGRAAIGGMNAPTSSHRFGGVSHEDDV